MVNFWHVDCTNRDWSVLLLCDFLMTFLPRKGKLKEYNLKDNCKTIAPPFSNLYFCWIVEEFISKLVIRLCYSRVVQIIFQKKERRQQHKGLNKMLATGSRRELYHHDDSALNSTNECDIGTDVPEPYTYVDGKRNVCCLNGTKSSWNCVILEISLKDDLFNL